MNSQTTKKIIAMVLTAAMAMSPVFAAPISAADGQDVEESASSWRYQDGDIVAEEGLDPLDADAADYDLREDFNAQMGSSMKQEEQVAEAVPEADSEQPDESASDGQSFVAPNEQQEATPEEQAVTEEQPAAEEQAVTEEQALQGEQLPQGDEVLQEGVDSEESAGSEEPAEEDNVQTSQLTAEQLPAEQTAPTAQAPQQAPQEVQQAPETAVQDTEEPSVRIMSETARDRYWTWSKGKYTRGPGYLKGIDVSYWQGTIDWKKVKEAGVDFAIIRCGYGANTSSQDDSKFAANVKGCIANGIPYGVYLYAHANTVAKAQDEANHAIRLLKANNCSLSYPIYYDLEDSRVSKAGSATITKMADAFCSKLKNAGYPSGVYANLNWWNNKLASFDGYDRWVAQWASSCDYKKPYSIWQCTSSTTISGISGRVDANLLMCPKSVIDKYMNKLVVTYSFQTINGKVYLIGSTGTVIKNRFLKFGGYLYAFDENGVRQAGKKFRIGYKSYILDSKGRAYLFKAKAKKKIPYYAKAGKGKKGKLKKGKSFYVLRTSGRWSQMANGYWVKTSLTTKTALYPTITPAVKVKYKAKVTKKARSYSGPSSKYIKKKLFKKNKIVTVIGTYGKWSKLSTGQWLPSKRLKKK